MDDDDIYGISRPSTPPAPSPLGEQSTLEFPVPAATFAKLPDEIIAQILHISTPSSFASLVLLNSNWRRVAQRCDLYELQLSRCRQITNRPVPAKLPAQDLSTLKMMFAEEVKRNLFDAYLRPTETRISLVSTSFSSSAAFPGGEAFHFSFSPNGHQILAYSSSRIYVIDPLQEEIVVRRELKIVRRPVFVTILDDGSLLAVLSFDQVDLYRMSSSPPKHIRAIALDHPPRTIALSPRGAVLAAAYDGGVEVYSLHEDSTITDRRAVKCDAADSLTFSDDGTLLLGTTLHTKNPSTIILTAPYFDPGDGLPEESISQLWTTSIIFPNSSHDCSHAVLLPSVLDDETSWTFTYDRVFETFRAVKIDDLRNGTTYFTGPVGRHNSTVKLLPSTLPATTARGDLVSAGFQDKDIWIYGIPADKTAIPATAQHTESGGSSPDDISRMSSSASSRSQNHMGDQSGQKIPQWQALCAKNRNMFVGGRNIAHLAGISALTWVRQKDSQMERLIAVAPGVTGHQLASGDDGIPPLDGGRLAILDFSYGPNNGLRRMITIEVGDGEPELLEEESMDLETEVAMVRRRTVARGRSGHGSVFRSATIAAPNSPNGNHSGRAANSMPFESSWPIRRRLSRPYERSEGGSENADDDVLDMPYAQGEPRAPDTLRRAATAAAANRRLNPPRRGEEHVEFRRADGREEHPHESDADNWVPPPPPYTTEAIAPLPEHLRNAVAAGVLPAVRPSSLHRSATQRTSSSAESDIYASLQRSRTTYNSRGDTPRHVAFAHNRTRSASTITSNSARSFTSDISLSQRPFQTDTTGDDSDVSPPGTPTANASPECEITSPHELIRRAVASPAPADEPLLSDHPSPLLASSPDEEVAIAQYRLNQPISPIPQPQQLVTHHQATQNSSSSIIPHRRDIPSPVDSLAGTDTNLTGRSVSPISRERLSAPVPPRPDNDHRLSAPLEEEGAMSADVASPVSAPSPPLPPSPVFRKNAQDANMSGKRRSFTAPAIIQQTQSDTSVENVFLASLDLEGPSAAQLARLSTRSGRPNSRILTDPSRRNSSSSMGSVRDQFVTAVVPSRGQKPVHRIPIQSIQVPLRIIAQDSQTASAGGFDQRNDRCTERESAFMEIPPGTSYTARTKSMSSTSSAGARSDRGVSLPPKTRPKPTRLETIHSVASTGDGANGFHNRGDRRGSQFGSQGGGAVERKASRAERSASVTVQQKSKRSWRKSGISMVKGKSLNGGGELAKKDKEKEKKEKKEKRCIMM